MNDIEFKAYNIVNQLADFYSEKIPSDKWLDVRQASNDELDHFVQKLLHELVQPYVLDIAKINTELEGVEKEIENVETIINLLKTGAEKVVNELASERRRATEASREREVYKNQRDAAESALERARQEYMERITAAEAEIEQLKGQRRDGFTAASEAQREVSNLQQTVEEDKTYIKRMESERDAAIRERDEVRRYERDNHHNAQMCPYCTPDPAQREQPWFKSNPRSPQEAESKFFIVPSGMKLRYPPQYAVWQGDDFDEAKRVREDMRKRGEKTKLYSASGARLQVKEEEQS